MLKQALISSFYQLAEHDAALSEMSELEIRTERRWQRAATVGAIGLLGAGVVLGKQVIDYLPNDNKAYAAIRAAATFANFVGIGLAAWIGGSHLLMAQNSTKELQEREFAAVPPDVIDLAA